MGYLPRYRPSGYVSTMYLCLDVHVFPYDIVDLFDLHITSTHLTRFIIIIVSNCIQQKQNLDCHGQWWQCPRSE